MRKQYPYAGIVILAAWIFVPGVAVSLMDGRDPSIGHRSGLNCANPTATDAGKCKHIEEIILRSTVRFVVEAWTVRAGEPGYHTDYSTGYGAIKGGRYLVTHNHFSVPLSIRSRAGEPEAYGALTLFNSWSSVSLAAGMEVAQVDWDGAATRVDWTTVKEINVVDGLPWMILTDEVTIGASGGGVLWQGVHIANNSRLVQYMDESGAQIGASTKAALNSVQVAGEPYQIPFSMVQSKGIGKAGK